MAVRAERGTVGTIPRVTVVFVLVTIVVVVVIALVSIGRVTFSLAAQPPPTFFNVDEAVIFIAERLPDEVTAELSYDDVRQIIEWHVEYLEGTGVAATREGELIVLSAEGAGPVIAADDEGVAHVLGRIADAGLEINDGAVVEVLEVEATYLRAIGAVGSVVPPPVDPGAERS
jgi:hypothetical protein